MLGFRARPNINFHFDENEGIVLFCKKVHDSTAKCWPSSHGSRKRHRSQVCVSNRPLYGSTSSWMAAAGCRKIVTYSSSERVGHRRSTSSGSYCHKSRRWATPAAKRLNFLPVSTFLFFIIGCIFHLFNFLGQKWNELLLASQKVTIQHSGWMKINITEGVQKWFSTSSSSSSSVI